jgi:hypothetical protein
MCGVSDANEKYTAGNLASNVANVRHVDNELEIKHLN